MSCFAEFPKVSIFFGGSQQGAGVLFFPQGLCRQRGRSIVPVPLSHPAVIGQGHVGKNIDNIFQPKKLSQTLQVPKKRVCCIVLFQRKRVAFICFYRYFPRSSFLLEHCFFSRSWVSVRLGWSKLLSPSLFFDFLIWEGPKFVGTETRQTTTDSPGSG